MEKEQQLHEWEAKHISLSVNGRCTWPTVMPRCMFWITWINLGWYEASLCCSAPKLWRDLCTGVVSLHGVKEWEGSTPCLLSRVLNQAEIIWKRLYREGMWLVGKEGIFSSIPIMFQESSQNKHLKYFLSRSQVGAHAFICVHHSSWKPSSKTSEACALLTFPPGLLLPWARSLIKFSVL